jgi:hypothetical protein
MTDTMSPETRTAAIEALAAFLGEDERFQVGVGGNPNAVEAMIQRARAALALLREDDGWQPLYSAPYDELVEWRIDALGLSGVHKVFAHQMIKRKSGKKPYWLTPQDNGAFLIAGWDATRITAWRRIDLPTAKKPSHD